MVDMKFMTQNRVEQFSTITVSTGSDTAKSYLYDRNFSTKWQSVGSDDLTTETIEIIWSSAKTIDRIALIGHNLKAFHIEYWNGAAYADFTSAINPTGCSDSNSFWEVTQVSTLKLRVTMTTTQTTDQQKEISELLAYAEIFEIPDRYLADSENRQAHFRQFEHETADGGNVIVVEATAEKYWNIFSWNLLPETYRDYISALKQTHSSFWFMPRNTFVAEQYYVNMINYQFSLAMGWAGSDQCWAGNMEIKET